MFNNKANTVDGEDTPKPVRNPSVVGTDMRIIGEVISDGEVRIEGRLEGDINCKSVTIAEDAEVRGNVDAEELILHGALIGSVRAKVVRLIASSLMMGDVAHEVLMVEPGAKIEGRCRPARYREDVKVPRPTVKPEGPPKGPTEKVAATPAKGAEKKPEPALEGAGAPTALQ